VVTFDARVYAPGVRPRSAASFQAKSWIGTIETADERPVP
jgi:hypothetical protein